MNQPDAFERDQLEALQYEPPMKFPMMTLLISAIAILLALNIEPERAELPYIDVPPDVVDLVKLDLPADKGDIVDPDSAVAYFDDGLGTVSLNPDLLNIVVTQFLSTNTDRIVSGNGWALKETKQVTVDWKTVSITRPICEYDRQSAAQGTTLAISAIQCLAIHYETLNQEGYAITNRVLEIVFKDKTNTVVLEEIGRSKELQTRQTLGNAVN